MAVLGIAAELSAPPSSPMCFRDLTLQAAIRRYDVIAISPAEMLDLYVKWMRQRGLFDYVDDILPREQVGEMKIEVEGGPGASLTAHNLHIVVALL